MRISDQFLFGLAILLVGVTLGHAQTQTWTITDPENDQVLCRDGTPGPTDRGSIDIVEVRAERSGEYNVYTIRTRRAVTGSESIAGGVEHWVPAPFARQPNFDPNWYPNNFGTCSHNGSWNATGSSIGFAQVGEDGNWSQGTTVAMVSTAGDEVTFMIPVFEHPNGGFIVFTITDYIINSSNPTCDFVGLGENGFPELVPPGALTVTDIYTFNGNTPITVPAPGLLANDAEVCDNTQGDPAGSWGVPEAADDGGFTYTPLTGFNQVDGFRYDATCGGQTATGFVSLVPTDAIIYGDQNAPPGGDGSFTNPASNWAEFEAALEQQRGNVAAARFVDGLTWSDGTAVSPDDFIWAGSGSTADLAQYGLNVAPFGEDRVAGDPAVIQLQPNGSIHVGKDNTIYNIELNPTGGGTAITGEDFGTLILDNVTIRGDGHAVDLVGGNADFTIPTIETPSIFTPTWALNNVSGTADVEEVDVQDGASEGSAIIIRNSPDFNITFDDVQIENRGGGIWLDDVGSVSISGGFITTETGLAVWVDNTQLDWNLQEINSSDPVTLSIRSDDVTGTVDVEDVQVGGSANPYSISIEGGNADYSFGSIRIESTGGGLYTDFDGTLNIESSTFHVEQQPAIDLTGGTYGMQMDEIRSTATISSTMSLKNASGVWNADRMDVEANSEAPVVNFDNTSGIIKLNNVNVTNAGGDAIVVQNSDGSFQITNADLDATGRGIYLPLILKNPGSKSSDGSAPNLGFIVQNSTITAGTGYAVEVRSDDPAEVTVAIEGNTLSGADGEISLVAEEGGNITLANFPGGDAAAVAAFLQAANEGEPRIDVQGEIGPGENITAVEPTGSELPQSIRLGQNFPNPFNPSTTIEFDLPESGFVELSVYNAFGQQVALLQNGELGAGTYRVTWNAERNAGGRQLASGVYIYRLRAGGKVVSKSLTLIK